VSTGHSLETLTADDFRGHQGTRFRLTGSPSGESVEAELADVTGYGSGTPGTFRAPFAVVFRGPLRPVLPQGIYHVEHEQLGTLELFLVPIGPDEPPAPGQPPTAMRYEAVFG
jgi:hypothetical protein